MPSLTENRTPAQAGPTQDAADTARRARVLPLPETAIVVSLGFLCGISPAFRGYYDIEIWGVAALAIFSLLLALVVARPAPIGNVGLAALTGLILFGAWSLLSTTWAESADGAIVSTSRWLLYAAGFAVLLIALHKSERLAVVLMACVTIGVLGIGAYLVATILSGDGSSLFQGERMYKPLGYTGGQAAALMLGFWPLVAIAESARSRLLAGGAVAACIVLSALMALTQSRAASLALVVSAVTLVAAVPGRARRLWVLVFVLGALAVIADPLLNVFQHHAPGSPPSDETIRSAIIAALAVAVVAGVLWAVADTIVAAVSRRSMPARRVLQWSSIAALTVILVGSGAVIAATSHPVQRVKREYHNFVTLRPPGADARLRLLSGGGNRYEVWRVSIDQFEEHPWRGVGAGNFPTAWFHNRRITEDIRQQHSIELQALADLGVVGAVFLAMFLISVFVGFRRRVLAAKRAEPDRFLAVAGGGVFLVWLAHTSVDWLHLLPGVTGVALCGAAVLARQTDPAPQDEPRARSKLAVLALCALAVTAAAVVVAGPTLSEFHRQTGKRELSSNPHGALKQADQALAFNDESVQNYFLESAAYARLDRYGPARASLLEAIRREPSNFLPWALLGDLAVRRGYLRQAKRDYRAALRRNPRDPLLRQLAQRPSIALAQVG